MKRAEILINLALGVAGSIIANALWQFGWKGLVNLYKKTTSVYLLIVSRCISLSNKSVPVSFTVLIALGLPVLLLLINPPNKVLAPATLDIETEILRLKEVNKQLRKEAQKLRHSKKTLLV